MPWCPFPYDTDLPITRGGVCQGPTPILQSSVALALLRPSPGGTSHHHLITIKGTNLQLDRNILKKSPRDIAGTHLLPIAMATEGVHLPRSIVQSVCPLATNLVDPSVCPLLDTPIHLDEGSGPGMIMTGDHLIIAGGVGLLPITGETYTRLIAEETRPHQGGEGARPLLVTREYLHIIRRSLCLHLDAEETRPRHVAGGPRPHVGWPLLLPRGGGRRGVLLIQVVILPEAPPIVTHPCHHLISLKPHPPSIRRCPLEVCVLPHPLLTPAWTPCLTLLAPPLTGKGGV